MTNMTLVLLQALDMPVYELKILGLLSELIKPTKLC